MILSLLIIGLAMMMIGWFLFKVKPIHPLLAQIFGGFLIIVGFLNILQGGLL